MKFLIILIPIIINAQIPNDLLRDCALGKNEKCAEIGEIRMDKYGPDYDPSLAISYLERGCNVSGYSCFKIAEYYKEKNDIERSKSYFKKACQLKHPVACYKLNEK